MNALTYRIALERKTHHYRVTLTFVAQQAGLVSLRLPAWVPGSYARRDLAGHVSRLTLSQKRNPIDVQKVDINAFSAAVDEGSVTLSYRVYAFDPSVRLAYLDLDRAFFNPTSLLIAPEGAEALPVKIELEGVSSESVATTLPFDGEAFFARNLYAAYDSPFEIGARQKLEFTASGVPHRTVFTGDTSFLDDATMRRIAEDFRAIAEATIAFFDPETRKAPFENYLCTVFLAKGMHGGLEHASGTALVADPEDVVIGTPEYGDFLELFAHEYFHAWWVKRVRPSVFVSPNLTRESPTRLLWVFEGFTVYYAIRMMIASKRKAASSFATSLTELAQRTLTQSARRFESLEAASLEAWIKYYRVDGDRLNAVTDYYAYGALIAFALDAEIREKSEGKASLDDVLRFAYATWRTDPRCYGGIPEAEFANLFKEALGMDFSNEIEDYTRRCVLPDFAKLSGVFGMRFEELPARCDTAGFGAKWKYRDGKVVVRAVSEETCAAFAGLAEGDVLVSVNDQKPVVSEPRNERELEKALDTYFLSFEGKRLTIVVTRFGRDLTLETEGPFYGMRPNYRFTHV